MPVFHRHQHQQQQQPSSSYDNDNRSFSFINGKDMDETYDRLAKHAMEKWKSLQSCEDQSDNNRGHKYYCPLWVALAGAPGAGKTTVANAVVERISMIFADDEDMNDMEAICIPMDGYHVTQARLKEQQMDMKRRGAPWTFDAETMYQDLKRAKEAQLKCCQQRKSDVIYLPGYSREISDPVPGMIQLKTCRHQIIFVEGLYVLLGSLCSGHDCCQDRNNNDGDDDYESLRQTFANMEQQDEWPKYTTTTIAQEVKRWQSLMQLWDETWFVAPPAGLEENKRRLVNRSLKTWTPQKTQLWASAGNNDDGKDNAVVMTDRQAAERRVDFNDLKNARLIQLCQPRADVRIDSI